MTAPWHGSAPGDFPTQSGVTATITGANGARCYYGTNYGVTGYAGYIQSPQQTPRTDGASGHARNTATYASGNTLAAWLNSSGIEVLRIRSIGSLQYQLQYWNGSGWTGIGSGGTTTSGVSADYRYLIEFTGLGTASGSLRFIIVNDITSSNVVDETATGLDLTSATNVDRLRLYSHNLSSNSYTVREAFIKDGSADTTYGYNSRVTADGSDTAGSATYTAVDDLNTSNPDTDFSSLAASGDRESYKSAARDFGGRNVLSLGFTTRLRCGATGPTQVKPYLTIGGTRYYHASSPVTLTTSFVDYSFDWETDPSTSSPWGASNAESANTEFGIEVV